jgi:2,3-bisphosphoglycerate-independent phosphoglycerate mutase
VHQDLSSISEMIENGEFFSNKILKEAFKKARENNKEVHLLGLLSDGGIHSHIDHLFALLEMAKQEKVGDKTIIHIMTDGRDTPTTEALHYLDKLEKKMKELRVGKIGSLSGRYFGMDRENHWERTERIYNTLVGIHNSDALTARRAITDGYRMGKTDEFISPTLIRDEQQKLHYINDGDVVIFYHFRADRSLQLTKAFVQQNFDRFNRQILRKDLSFVTFASYNEGLPIIEAFPPKTILNPLAKVLADHHWKQLHVAETAKYPHVTYFFNGGREDPFSLEERLLVESPDVPTYDQAPEMSAYELTNKITKRIKDFDFVVINYANTDMVGHSGRIRPTIRAVEVIDECLGKLIESVKKANGNIIITADHGNAEQMVNPVTGTADPEHTTNPVPFFMVTNDKKVKLRPSGILADVAPTILDYCGLPIPREMTGKSLIVEVENGKTI